MKDYLKDQLKAIFPDAPREEEDRKSGLVEFTIKSLPFIAAAAALYIFMKYGALIALMMIFSFVFIFFWGGVVLRAARMFKEKKKRGKEKNRSHQSLD